MLLVSNISSVSFDSCNKECCFLDNFVLQQQNQARKMLVLVPKSGTRSKVSGGDTSADELEAALSLLILLGGYLPTPNNPDHLQKDSYVSYLHLLLLDGKKGVRFRRYSNDADGVVLIHPNVAKLARRYKL